MKKRLNQISAYEVTGTKGAYTVALERLHNTPSGCPRFKAFIIKHEENKAGKISFEDGRSLYNAVYTFHGHYLGERLEAAWIVSEYGNEIKDQGGYLCNTRS